MKEPIKLTGEILGIEAFIHYIAWRFKDSGVEHKDLFNAGVRGALTALESYDPEQGTEFLICAHSFVINAIQDAAIEKFVYKIAHQYRRKDLPLDRDYQFDDLASAGKLAALEALKLYDPTKGVKFLSFAGIYIKTAIRDEANQSGVTTPAWFRSQVIKPVIKTFDRLTGELGREPKTGEVVEDIKLRIELVKKVTSLKNVDDEEITAQIELAIQQAFIYGWLSLEDSSYEPADPNVNVEEKVAQALAAEELELMLRRVLNNRELTAASFRFGLNGKDETTLKNIADELGISPPRAHQIVDAALKRIEADPELMKIADALGYAGNQQ